MEWQTKEIDRSQVSVSRDLTMHYNFGYEKKVRDRAETGLLVFDYSGFLEQGRYD